MDTATKTKLVGHLDTAYNAIGQKNTTARTNVAEAKKIVVAEPVTDTPPDPEPEPTFVARDTCVNGSHSYVLDLWGGAAIVSPDRLNHFSSGGPKGLPYRSLTATPNDILAGSPRAELGNNDHRDNGTRTFHLYREGDHTITRFWQRLAPGYAITNPRMGVLMQMKQTQPSASGGSNPVLALEAKDGKFKIHNWSPNVGTRAIAECPGFVNIWIEWIFDVVYSVDPAKGSIRWVGQREDGSKIVDVTRQTNTLKRETLSGGGIPQGQPIPSHLRWGTYQAPDRPTQTVHGADFRIE